MKKNELVPEPVILGLLLSVFACSCVNKTVEVNDPQGVLAKTEAPVKISVKLSHKQLDAAKEGTLYLADLADKENLIAVQAEENGKDGNADLTFLMPKGNPGKRKFRLTATGLHSPETMKAYAEKETGQILVEEGTKKVLQYNYQKIYEKDVIRAVNERKEDEKDYVRNERDTFTVTSIYAVPRSDYIHPLYGLQGEMLTRDWPDQIHPHHRGIFWAWPEVYYGTESGDIYALQKVFARPSGNTELTGGAVFAQVTAENTWMWKDTEPIVNEKAFIRVYRSSSTSRIIDLTVQLVALKDSITLATRYTNTYGGLNIRMQTPVNQEISYHTDPAGVDPRRAWSGFRGTFGDAAFPSGLMVLQHHRNPEYPGAWVQYPNLAWVQPTFPTPDTRFRLEKDKPLVLRYRFTIDKIEDPDGITPENRWDAYHSEVTPLI